MRPYLKRFTLCLLIACCAVSCTQAIPAYPRRVKIVTNADTFYLTLKGDEQYKFAVTDDGHTALPDSDGWYYAAINQAGEVVKSEYKVCSESRKSVETRSFLSTLAKGLMPHFFSDSVKVQMPFHHSSIRHSSNKIVGNRRVLIILMQYSDVRFVKSQTDFDRLFNGHNYNDDGAYGSVYDYYNKVSYGQLQLECDVLGPYTASKNMAYYGGNSSRTSGDMNPKALFDEAISFAIQEVNLADYDSDGDGYVDNVHIIFAGYGEEAGAPANAIWSHEMTFRAETIGGMMIDRYSCSPELRGNSGSGITRIGPPCHEIGHALGAMDFYDVDYQSGGYYDGTGDWDVMASGSWNDGGARPADFNPYVKAYNFGWVDVQRLEMDTVNVISPSTQKNSIYRIDTPISGDYFLLDNRQSEGVNSAEPGKGLLIFHIGPQIVQKALTNTINSTFPQQCYIVCASAKDSRPRASASSYGSISSAGCPYPGTSQKTSFTKSSIPGAYCVNGISAEISLTSIVQLPDGSISLRYGKDDSGEVIPPDDTPNDYGEIDGDIIWSDDFEITRLFQISAWNTVNLKGNGVWMTKKYSTSPSEKEPPILSGNRYMSMESSSTGTIMGESSRYSCSIVSQGIQLPAGDYVLVGNYGGYATRKISTDTLYVEIQAEDGNERISTKSLHIKKNVEWDGFAIPINSANDRLIHIVFTGSADEKSILFLDNVRLYKPTAENVEGLLNGYEEPSAVFSLDGNYLGNGNIVHSLYSGIYVIRQGRKSRKLYIKGGSQ